MRKEFFLIIVAVLITGCAQVAEEKQPLKLAINAWPGYAHAFVAQEKGIFEKNGVNVELLLSNRYGDVQEVYLSGNSDGVFGVYTDMLSHNANGVKTKVVYAIDFSDGGDVIVGKPEFKSLSDLENKKIGIDGVNTFSHLFVLTALEQQGITEGKVFFEDVAAVDLLVALEEGKIDAGHTWEPTTSKALEKGYIVLRKAGDLPGIIIDTLAFSEQTVQERPDDIQKVVASLEEARRYGLRNKGESIGIMARALGIKEKELREGIEGVHLLDMRENVEFFTESDSVFSLHGLHEIAGTFYVERGVLSEIPDADTIIEPMFVRELREQ